MLSRILSAALAAVALQGAARADACPRDAYSLTLEEGKALTCTCAGPVETTGAIYGTDRYTSDSQICMAAVHAGSITAEKGGEVSVYAGAGCPKFISTDRNGVTSSAWDAYDATFAFVSPLPACAAADPVVATSKPPPPAKGPAPDAGPKEWQARADRFAKALPRPLDGWTATEPRGEWSNDSMNGRFVAGVVWFKKNGNTLNSDLLVQIVNAPDGGPYGLGERLWTDEAYRTERKATKAMVAGREAVIVDPDGDHAVYFRVESGIYVVLSRLKSHTIVTAEDLEAYAKSLDFVKIEKLSPT